MKTYEPRSRFTRHLALVALAGFFFVLVAVVALSHPQNDFIEYWSSGHLLVAQQNPYSLSAMFKAQAEIGWRDNLPLMFLSPPWALSFVIPLAFVNSYVLGWLAWLTFLLIAVALASRMLMDIYFLDARIPEISDSAFYRSLFAFTFFPVLLCLKFTQTAPLMLLGLALFLFFEQRSEYGRAGMAMSLTLIKPQLFYLVWLGVLCEAVQGRKIKTLFSALISIGILTLAPLLFDPRILQDYWQLATSPYMQVYPSGVAALVRKLIGGVGTYWIQFVPSLLGVIWFARYWWRHGGNWKWIERMPMVLTMSLLTSAYGWHFDQLLLVLPVIALSGWRAREEGKLPTGLVALFTMLNIALMLLWPFPSLALLPAPVLLAFLLTRGTRASEAWVLRFLPLRQVD